MKKLFGVLTFTILYFFFLPGMAFADALTPPKDWLGSLGPKAGGLPNGGIEFITGNAIPFVVSMLFFLVIVLSFIYLMIGAILLMTSGGNKEGTAKARGTITYALLGLVIGIASLIILSVVGNLLGFNLIGN